VHARWLRLGIYTSAGTLTCDARGFPASLGHEAADAASFAAWGLDYVCPLYTSDAADELHCVDLGGRCEYLLSY